MGLFSFRNQLDAIFFRGSDSRCATFLSRTSWVFCGWSLLKFVSTLGQPLTIAQRVAHAPFAIISVAAAVIRLLDLGRFLEDLMHETNFFV